MLHAHPTIGGDTVRVRLTDFGASSIDINVRVHALTREWNEFFAIREDVFLRIKDIVSASGTSFALPAQTVHMTRDREADPASAAAAVSEVEEWRQSGRLPFPRIQPSGCPSSKVHSTGRLEAPSIPARPDLEPKSHSRPAFPRREGKVLPPRVDAVTRCSTQGPGSYRGHSRWLPPAACCRTGCRTTA